MRRLNLPQKYILDWMGHSESEILDMYITLHDETAQTAINAISFDLAESASAKPTTQASAERA